MSAYYSENDPVAAEWLRGLIAEGLLPDGEVDERDVRDVAPAELVRFTQCHFFAGIGIWPLALRSAGWPDDRPIWTGSCPCQPFSGAGAGEGFDDERHLWPFWHWLIQHGRPAVVVGEQVSGKDGLGWLDLVSDDLGGIGYTVGATALSAAGFGLGWRGSAEQERLERAVRDCPDPLVARHMAAFADWADQALGFGGFHVRERLYFVGLADDALGGLEGRGGLRDQGSPGLRRSVASDGLADGRVVDRERAGSQRQRGDVDRGDEPGRLDEDAARSTAAAGEPRGLADLDGERRGERGAAHDETGRVESGNDADGRGSSRRVADRPGRGRGKRGDATLEGPGGHADGRRDAPRGVADRDGGDAAEEREQRGGQHGRGTKDRGASWARDRWLGRGRREPGGTGEADGRRSDVDWLLCRDGLWRPVGPGAFPLADAPPGRVGMLRAYGNGLDFETATSFCEVVDEIVVERWGVTDDQI